MTTRYLAIAAAMWGLASLTWAQAPTPPTPPEDPTDPTTTEHPETTSSEDDERTVDMPPPAVPPESPDPSSRELPPYTRDQPRTMPQDPSIPRDAGDASMRTAAAAGSIDRHLASKIIGKGIESSKGEMLGEVKDVVLDRSGKVTHALVSYQGSAGARLRVAAVPWDALSSMMRGDSIVMERSRLQGAPSFEEQQPPNFASETWSREADRYWRSGRSAGEADTPERG
jgi:sporulation protein YlmC with PRC-barrel domain